MLQVKTPEEVLRLIETEFQPLADQTETVSLLNALGRVLAEDIVATEYVPGFDRSTVDGYAVRASDTFGCSDAIPAILPLAGEVKMGEEPSFSLSKGYCAAVPTGGSIPEGADCAIMIEYTENYGDGTIGISKPGTPGMNLIFRGDDVFPGKLVLEAGHVLAPQDIGALAAIGKTEVSVKKRLRVGIISTGDELVPAEQQPGPGQIRDVNGPLLSAMLCEFGAEPVSYGIVVDDETLLRQKTELAVKECDAVILSGGSSVGAKDAALRIIGSVGTLLLHGIAVKPGKPAIFGKSGNKPLIGLPGHPVGAFFVTKLFVLPLLAQLSCRKMAAFPIVAELTENVGANHGRTQINACRLEQIGEKLFALPIHSKSGLITQLSGADGFFIIDRDCEGLPKGAAVKIYR